MKPPARPGSQPRSACVSAAVGIALFFGLFASTSSAVGFGEPEFEVWWGQVYVDVGYPPEDFEAPWSWQPFEVALWYDMRRDHVSGYLGLVVSNSLAMDHSVYLGIMSFLRRPTEMSDRAGIAAVHASRIDSYPELPEQSIPIIDDGGAEHAMLHISGQGGLMRDFDCNLANTASNVAGIAVIKDGLAEWTYLHRVLSDSTDYWTWSLEDSIIVQAGDEVLIAAECTILADFTDVNGPWDELKSYNHITLELAEIGSGPTASPCCVDTLCHVLVESDCLAIGGEWIEDLAGCDPDPCDTAASPEPMAEDRGTMLLTPNPTARGVVEIEWTSAEPARTWLSVHDIQGRLVRDAQLGLMPAGEHHIEWAMQDDSGAPLPQGIYYLRINAGSSRYHQRLVHLSE